MRCCVYSKEEIKLIQSDDLPGPSGEVGTSDSEEDESLAFAKSFFSREQRRKGKLCTSTPKSTPKNTPKSRKDGKKAARKKAKVARKKTKATAVADEPTVLSFMRERAQERDEAFVEQMAEENNKSFQWML